MSGGAREQGRSVVSRVVAILEAFDAGHSRLTLSDISRGCRICSTARGSIERPTCYTVTESGRLARELVEVRERGWATTREEKTLGSGELDRLVRPVRAAVHRIERELCASDDLAPAARQATLVAL